MKKTEGPRYNETCVYTGRREGKKCILHRFEKPDGEEMYFSGIRGVHIGMTYRCGKTNIASRPELVMEVERIDNPEWDAADALIDAKRAEKRAEKKLAASTKPALKTAVSALQPLVRGMSYFDRKSLVEYLVEEAVKVGKKRR
jgi:hypothetical protein